MAAAAPFPLLAPPAECAGTDAAEGSEDQLFVVHLSGYGSMTVRRRLAKRGVEPDECYVLGTVEDGGIPELAIEIIQKSGTIDKLSVYAGLGVPEVWFLKKGKLSVHLLGPDGYAEAGRSRLLPGIELAELMPFVQREGDQTSVVRAWRAMLRKQSAR
ncbi:Uma2 family endonuclease [Sorangium sp. So ce233]|uniref:Uma2 family endonuclease n=1 Tax=Sorangium sp. So ce233 TaxID=3133290 RepID=UPI003F5E2F7C